MERYKQIVGDFGEKLAKNYLISKGYVIVGTKIKLSYQEIDIIASIGNTVVFFEVKTRTSDILGGATEAITSRKIRNLKKAMEAYLEKHCLYDVNNFRLDLIAIDVDKFNKVAKIKHYKGLF